MSTTAPEFRQYGPFDAFMIDGYPLAWKYIKHLVREQGGYRCARCLHPYVPKTSGLDNAGGRFLDSPSEARIVTNGEPEPVRVHVSVCDEQCRHGGPVVFAGEQWLEVVDDLQELVRDGLTEALWRILTVHHLDGDKANLRWWNLVPLCQRCHLTIQAKVYMDRPYNRPHSTWFKPYAAGFYAFKYLGEDLARQEVDARLDTLLDLELRQERLFG